MSKAIDFKVESREGEARMGVLTTRRGVIETPVFMPVGTAGTVKGIRFEALESAELDARIILGNTYHLWLRPGIETIKACGGLHKFIGWERAMLTDSGGFQVWSLGALRKITEEGTEFRSHVDGALCFLSPEISMEVQEALDAEIAMAFDECAPGKATNEEARRSMELTLRWAKRSKKAFEKLQSYRTASGSDRLKTGKDAGEPQAGMPALPARQALFGIVQGASHLDLRRESLERTVEIGFDGYAIGGLSVGEEKSVMLDCVLPTRNGRNGQAFTSRGKLNIKNAQYVVDQQPLDEDCGCSVCHRHSRAFLRHLYLSGEMLGGILLTHHNLAFFLDTMRRVRQAIRSGQFANFRREYTEQIGSGWG